MTTLSTLSGDHLDGIDAQHRLHFANLASRFLGISEELALRRMLREATHPGVGVAEAWNRVSPRTPEDIRQFYAATDSYIFDLAADHCRPQRRRVWQVVTRRIARIGRGLRILAYGDGIGTDSLALARLGHLVTYFDVPGVTSRFARFCFQEAGFGDRIVVCTEQESIPREAFDAIVCIEVLEHLPDPVETMARLLHYLRVGGRLLLTESFGSVGPEFPSHLPSNSRYAGVTCRIMEGLGAVSTFYNTDPINYPMEFMRIRPGLKRDLLRLALRMRRAAETRLRRLTAGKVRD